MIANGFRFLAPRIPKRSGHIVYPPALSFTGGSSRRRAASVAAIVAATSALTALAASQQGSSASDQNHNNNNWNLHHQSTTTSCEGQSTADASIRTLPESLLKYDHYNGVIVHLDWIFNFPPTGNDNGEAPPDLEQQEELQQLYRAWCEHPSIFERILERSLAKWKDEGRKGIWIHLPRSMAGIVPSCVNLGFDFHSCQTHNRINAGLETGSTNLILSQWLPTDVKSRLPLGPYFQAGVGCVLLSEDSQKMLVVQEITGPAAARQLWKMPTGLIDPGEDIAEAAVRELAEETGLHNAECQGIMAFRQAHGASAGRASSDLFFVCLMKLPKEQQYSLDDLKPQEHEILAIQWMPIEEYCNQEIWQKSPVYQQLNQAILDAAEKQRQGKASPMVVPRQLPVGFMAGTNTVYSSSKL